MAGFGAKHSHDVVHERRKPNERYQTLASVEAKVAQNVDEELTECLKIAEDALIRAVNLFSGQKKPNRRAGYQKSITHAQEAVTALLREELVLVRGHMTPKGKIKV